MNKILRCPQCGGVIEFDESYDTMYGDTCIIVNCAGTCSECHQSYLYDEKYEFTEFTGLQKEEPYNV